MAEYMNASEASRFFKDLYATEPEFRAFIEAFGEAFVQPAIKAIRAGDKELAHKLLIGGFGIAGAAAGSLPAVEIATKMLKEPIKP